MGVGGRLVAGILGLSGFLVLPPALAQEQYFGINLGRTDSGRGMAVPDLITSGEFDGKDNGYKFYGGYFLSPRLALEVAYVNLGSSTYSGTLNGTPVTGGRVETLGFNGAILGRLPLSTKFSLFGRVGVFLWSAEAWDSTWWPFSGLATGTDLSFGAGGSYQHSESFSVTVEWENYQTVDTITFLSIGLVAKF